MSQFTDPDFSAVEIVPSGLIDKIARLVDKHVTAADERYDQLQNVEDSNGDTAYYADSDAQITSNRNTARTILDVVEIIYGKHGVEIIEQRVLWLMNERQKRTKLFREYRA
jgi:hypothetical protein